MPKGQLSGSRTKLEFLLLALRHQYINFWKSSRRLVWQHHLSRWQSSFGAFFPLRNCVSVNGWVGWLLSSYFIDARIIRAENPKPWQNKNRPHLLLPLSVPHSSWLESRVRFRGQDGCLVKLCQQPSCLPATLLHLSVTGLPAWLSSQFLLFHFGNGYLVYIMNNDKSYLYNSYKGLLDRNINFLPILEYKSRIALMCILSFNKIWRKDFLLFFFSVKSEC